MVSISLGYFKDELISMYRMLRTESAAQEYPINVMWYYCGVAAITAIAIAICIISQVGHLTIKASGKAFLRK